MTNFVKLNTMTLKIGRFFIQITWLFNISYLFWKFVISPDKQRDYFRFGLNCFLLSLGFLFMAKLRAVAGSRITK